MILLTIIIPAYNVEKYLDEALAPYFQIKDTKYLEILIINDGSLDNTLQLANKYEKDYPELIKVINKKNGGHGSAINTGVKYARGKYFKVVDGDDWVDTNALEKLLQILAIVNSDMVATGFTIVCEDVGQKEEVHIRNVEYGKEYYFENICSSIEYIRMHSLFYKTQIWLENHIVLDEHCFYVDVEHDLLPLVWAKTIIFYHELLYQYRIGRPGQSVSMKSMIKNRENHMRVIRRIMNLFKDNSLPDSVNVYIERRIANMVCVQYSILFAAGTGENERKELLEFDRWVKLNNRKVYSLEKQKKILLMRMMGFRNYYIVKFFYRLLGKKENDYVK